MLCHCAFGFGFVLTKSLPISSRVSAALTPRPIDRHRTMAMAGALDAAFDSLETVLRTSTGAQHNETASALHAWPHWRQVERWCARDPLLSSAFVTADELACFLFCACVRLLRVPVSLCVNAFQRIYLDSTELSCVALGAGTPQHHKPRRHFHR